jgi:uncharacterized protein
MSDQVQRAPAQRGKQGFASMDPARVREIASQGGNSVPSEKRPFARNRQLAAEAGRKGGQRSHRTLRETAQ